MSEQTPTSHEAEGPQLTGEATHRPVVGAVIVAAFAALLAIGLVDLPRDRAPLPAVARYAMDVALPKWGITEPVNEVVYGTRGFDTFGETFLLLAAVVSVIVLTRQKEARRGFIGEQFAGRLEQAQSDPPSGGGLVEARQAERKEVIAPSGPLTPDRELLGTPAPEQAQGMSVVARTATRVVAPLLAIAGIYLVAWGYSPGGGFPAGAVILGVVLLIYATYGYRKVARVVDPKVFEPLELGGALLIIGVELLGLILKGSFSANWLPLAQTQTIPSGGILQLFSGGEFIEVATGLVLVVFALLGMRHDWAPDAQEEEPASGSRAPR
jgi:multicomponent Na+:H+ antiporter subunit B